MSRIHQLSPHLANQIAAGEVVERPSSVLKELLENSLDAGSTQIDIIIKRGGIGLIQVHDNGCGICKDDLEMALLQHATSKIFTLEDLEGVESFGFRGEALASISAVSRFQLSSRVLEAEHGWGIQKEGRDSERGLAPLPHPVGTRIEVRDLFYNTPARRKFLKSEKTELDHLEEIFKRIALSQPQVAFNFSDGERVKKRLPICQNSEAHARRVALLCGQGFINKAIYVDAESNGLKLTGWLGTSENTRAQPDLQYFYVNGRIVRDKVVVHAVRQAYQAICPPGRYPAYLLYFELDPSAVDVNVHPTKHEVRFRETRIVHAFLAYSVKEALSQTGHPFLLPLSTDFTEEKIEKVESKHLYEKTWKKDQISVIGGELLLIENDLGVLIIDAKAIVRASTLHLLKEAYFKENIISKSLLMPKNIYMEETLENFDSCLLDFQKLGFELDQIGPSELLIRSVPELLGSSTEKLEKLIQSLFKATDLESQFELIAEYRAQQSLSEMDIETILQKHTQYPHLSRQLSFEGLREALCI